MRPRPGTWAVRLGVVLLLVGAALVLRDGLGGSGVAPLVGQAESFRGPAPTPTPTSTPGPAPGRLTVSKPRAAASGPFAASSGAAGLTPVTRGSTAHPERVPFPPTSVRFVAGGAAATAPVDPVGTGDDGSLGLPADPARMGWWTGGSPAGAPYGSVVLAGHLDSRRQGLGFAVRMTTLQRGDVVVLAAGDRQRRYRVAARYLLPRTRLTELARLFSTRGPARLVLLTCGGSYDASVGAYSDNLVVEATPLT